MKTVKAENFRILVAEDDPDDRYIIEEAFAEAGIQSGRLRFVENGCELINCLREEGDDESGDSYCRPNLIFIDINMPEMNGFEALKIIKEDRLLKNIPVIMISTSTDLKDICASYSLGVNSYITKPSSFSSMVESMTGVLNYWLNVVELPTPCGDA